MIGSLIGIDTYIALGMVGIVVIVFLISRMGILPKKSLPFVIAALALVFFGSILKSRRNNQLMKDLEELKKQIKERQKRLKELEDKYGASEQELNKVKAELDRQISAYEKTILDIKAKGEKEKERIDRLSGEELHSEFRTAIGDI